MSYSLKKYLRYRWAAKNEYSLHSPFMFDLYNEVFKKSRRHNQTFDAVEKLRQQLLRDQTVIHVTDLGAGSQVNTSPQRSISSITKNTSKTRKQARFLALLAHYLNCKTIVELGTSAGISTAYFALQNPGAAIYTIEGCPEIKRLADRNFNLLKLQNIQSLEGNFDDVLPVLLEKIRGFDLLYIDGNHTCEATLRYFDEAKKSAHNHSVVIFDDIYWSEGMTRAWKKIAADEKVTASVDVFAFGIVFFRKELSKQHFILKL